MERCKMITAEFTQEEVQSLIQSLEAERDQYLKQGLWSKQNQFHS